jgi:oligopeptide/dipeptide ABC transporter ATP-binding protein
VVCDEAVSALDVSVQAQVLNLLEDLQEEYQLSYMFIAHDLAVVRHIADRIAVMYLGRMVELATCDDLFEAPLHPYTQALLSAVPVPKPGRKRRRVILEGDVPNPINPPSGCHFHTRCPLAFDRCSVEVPALYDARPGHKVQCHLYEDADFPAEPIPIDGPLAAAAHARRAPKAVDDDETPNAWDDETAELDQFVGCEDMDVPNIGIPAVLADRADIGLGPFGEVVDPEDTFVGTIATLGSMLGEPETTDRKPLPPLAPPPVTPVPRFDPDDTATIADTPTLTPDLDRSTEDTDKVMGYSVDLSLGPILSDSIPPIHNDEGIPDGPASRLEEQETVPLSGVASPASKSPDSPKDDAPPVVSTVPERDSGDDG